LAGAPAARPAAVAPTVLLTGLPISSVSMLTPNQLATAPAAAELKTFVGLRGGLPRPRERQAKKNRVA